MLYTHKIILIIFVILYFIVSKKDKRWKCLLIDRYENIHILVNCSGHAHFLIRKNPKDIALGPSPELKL